MESNREQVRNEKLAEYFFNLSNTTLGTSVLGMIASGVYTENTKWWMVVLFAMIGLIASLIFIKVGDKFLKK